jgi:hypothetical protein
MLNFKQFVTEQNQAAVEQGVMVNGVPNVLIQKGVKQGTLDKNGLPCVLIQKPRRKAVNEDVTPSPKWTSVNDNAHLGERSAQVHEALASADKHIAADTHHIRHYSDDSNDLNTTLFKDHRYGRQSERHIGDHDTKGLDAAVNRNKLKHDLNVYSGVGFHPGHMAARHPEGHVHMAAYTSTSIDKHTALEFASEHEDENDEHHVIHFHLKKGQKGKYAAPHAIPSVEHEREFILPRQTTVKLHPEPTVHRSGGSIYNIWHAHVVDNK